MTNTKGGTVKPILYTLAGVGAWTLISVITAPLFGRAMRRLDDPELVARLRQLNQEPPAAWVDDTIRRCLNEVPNQ